MRRLLETVSQGPFYKERIIHTGAWINDYNGFVLIFLCPDPACSGVLIVDALLYPTV